MLFAACLKGWRKMLCAIPFFFIPLNKWETPFDSIPAQGSIGGIFAAFRAG